MGVKVSIEHWIESSLIMFSQKIWFEMVIKDLLDHQSVHIANAHLNKMQTKNGKFLILFIVGRDLALFSMKDKPHHAIKSFNDIEGFIDLNPQILFLKITA